MDIFDDFTVYSYLHYENALNIGWNIQSDPQDQEPDSVLASKILSYLDFRVNMTRGGGVLKKVSFHEKDYILGCAEIRVVAKDGTVYAVPDMVIDYISNGSYRAPDPLVKAVTDGIDPHGDEYASFLARYSAEHFWGASEAYIADYKNALQIVSSGDVNALSQYLDENPNALNIVTNEGSLLNAAIARKLEDIAFLLINRKIPLNKYNGKELFTAIDCGMTSVAEKLIDSGITLNHYSPQCNPLFYAIMKQDNATAKKLAQNYKQLFCVYNTPYIRNCNVLQWCLKCNNREMFQYISAVNKY